MIWLRMLSGLSLCAIVAFGRFAPAKPVASQPPLWGKALTVEGKPPPCFDRKFKLVNPDGGEYVASLAESCSEDGPMVWVTDALSGRVVFSFPLDDMTMKPVFEAIDIDGDGLADLVFTWDSRGLGGGTATVSVLRMKAGTIASFEVYADRNLGTKESFSGDARQKSMKNLRAALKTKWKAVFADWGL